MADKKDLPIGVFDSGVGGLTVLKALQATLPHESFIYLGDTARLPYGTKSPETIIKYAIQATQILVSQGIKMLVIACNTASTLAYDALCEHYPDLPIIDVVRPGSASAVEASVSGDIAVIATEATVQSGGYQRLIKALNPTANVQAVSASVLVALAEEGWVDNDVAVAAARHYLQPLLKEASTFHPDCILLGCTHFPALLPAIEVVVDQRIQIVDSATATAMAVLKALPKEGLVKLSGNQSTRFFVTDAPDRFARVARQFLELELPRSNIELVDIGHIISVDPISPVQSK